MSHAHDDLDSHESASRLASSRRVYRLLLLITTLGVLLVVLLPIGGFLGRVVTWAARLHSVIGTPAFLTPTGWEFLLNIILFFPTFLLAARVWPRLNHWLWVLVAFGSSVAIEVFQSSFLPRSGSISDVVANTLGGAIGAFISFQMDAMSALRHRSLPTAEPPAG